MNIPSWATVAYHWGSNVCYSNGVKFVGYCGEHEIWRGQWENPGTSPESQWAARMKKVTRSFRTEYLILIEENE